MTAAGAFTSAYDSKAPQEIAKKAQVNAIYQLGSPPPPDKHKKERHRTAHQPEGSHTERCRPSPEKTLGVFLKTKV